MIASKPVLRTPTPCCCSMNIQSLAYGDTVTHFGVTVDIVFVGMLASKLVCLVYGMELKSVDNVDGHMAPVATITH